MSRRKNCSPAGHYPGKKEKEERDSSSSSEEEKLSNIIHEFPDLHIEFPVWRPDFHNLYAFSHPLRIESAQLATVRRLRPISKLFSSR